MAHSAAGGVGFGAGEYFYPAQVAMTADRSFLGAAIGGGLVRAIF